MKIGTYYYPEQWPREQWERDFDRMKGMGLQMVHLGEFAWGTIEPREGEYHFDWLADCIELAARRKMDVILCTPTAVLPSWFFDKHPDAFFTGKRFGGRRHANHLHPAVQEYSRKITAELANRFGDHPAVIGWQIDNELNGPFDQSNYTHEAFRNWLRNRYETIDNLNSAWGTQFWNTFYSDWSQIRFPASREVSDNYDNPHEHLDASRFWSWSFAQYAKLQADVLKPKIGNRWITTNFMPFFLDIDPMDTADVFTMSTWDAYPVSGLDKAPPDEQYRMASPSFLGFIHDQMASYQGRWGQMELQPGTINWSGVPVLLYPGAVRLWIWTAFAHGAEFVTTYRFRQPLWGTELFHHGLIMPDGETMSLGGREFSQTVEEVGRLRLDEIPPIAHEYDPKTTVGILFDFEQLWYYKTLPQAKAWDQARFLQQFYAALQRLGLRAKILHPNRDWPSDLKLIIAPGVQMVDDALVARMTDYVNRGGHLLLTARTGLMNRHGHLWQGPIGKPILPLIGASIEAYDGLPDGSVGHVEIIDAGHHEWGVWGDLLHAADDTRILVKYDDQFYAGGTAGVQKRHGPGMVTYSGVFGGQSYTDALVEKVVRQTSLSPTILTRRVIVMKRGPYNICLNYTDQTVDAPAKKGAKFVVGTKKVGPAGVAVWE